MSETSWKKILWTNDKVFLTAAKTHKAVRDCVRTQAGEALRFDLFVFYDNVGTVIENLHWGYRGANDDKHFESVLTHEHVEHPKAEFRVIGYKAEVEKE